MVGLATFKKYENQGVGMKMPALFVGHGSPMNLVEQNKYTETFQRLGRELPKPVSILVISAHWLTEQTEVLVSEQPKQIFDFFGFPDPLYKIQYSPKGPTEIAQNLVQKLQLTENPNTHSEDWGLDHGAWAVLHKMYPNQDIPVFQMSLAKRKNLIEHLSLAEELRFLQSQGVLIISSGNIVHNLRQMDWNPDAAPHSWAVEFEHFVLQTLKDQSLGSKEKIEKIFSANDLRMSHPTLEHLLPLVYTVGLMDPAGELKIEVEGIQNASVSMASVRV